MKGVRCWPRQQLFAQLLPVLSPSWTLYQQLDHHPFCVTGEVASLCNHIYDGEIKDKARYTGPWAAWWEGADLFPRNLTPLTHTCLISRGTSVLRGKFRNLETQETYLKRRKKSIVLKGQWTSTNSSQSDWWGIRALSAQSQVWAPGAASYGFYFQ